MHHSPQKHPQLLGAAERSSAGPKMKYYDAVILERIDSPVRLNGGTAPGQQIMTSREECGLSRGSQSAGALNKIAREEWKP